MDKMEYGAKTTRFEYVREFINEMLQGLDSSAEKQEACIYLYGVSTFSSMLAMRRVQNSDLAAIAGLLHYYYFYKTGIREFPGPNSAEAVRPFLRDTNIFTNDELIIILRAIFYQEDRSQVHGPYEEIVKDAVELHMYFQNVGNTCQPLKTQRIRKLLEELAIPNELDKEGEVIPDKLAPRNNGDRRRLLAKISEELAGQHIIGIPGDNRYRDICQYWPDSDIHKVLKSNWCAAFVYHCCRKAGIRIPIRYPNGICRFAGVGAWLEWAQLPETGFFYYDGQEGFMPQRGDIVIYDKLLSNDSHDHIGIVLACEDKQILVAEGNKNNENYSSVFRRSRQHCILGYIRIENDYQYIFSGHYTPVIS